MTTPALSGEDQPDPRAAMLDELLTCQEEGADLSVAYILEALDACDRAAGIRRVTGPFCECEHPKSRHWPAAPHNCEVPRCECNYYEQQGSRL